MKNIGGSICSLFATAILLTAGGTHLRAEENRLSVVFERTCLSSFDLFFSEAESYLERRGFRTYKNKSLPFVRFDNTSNGMHGSYSSDPYDYFCQVYDPEGDVLQAQGAGETLLKKYFDAEPRMTLKDGRPFAWVVPQAGGTCCDIQLRFDDRGADDRPGGALMSVMVKERE